MPELNMFGSLATKKEERPVADVSSFIGQFAAGYVEGLTTFDVLGDLEVAGKPHDTSEQISRSLGSVLGFVGFGWGALEKVGYSTTSKAFKLMGDVERAGTGITQSVYYANKAAAIKPILRSAPAIIGAKASSGVMRFFETSAAKEAMKFTEQLIGKELSATTKGFAKSTLESGLFMGFASAAGARPLNPLDIFTDDFWKDRGGAFLSGIPMGMVQGAMGSAFSEQTMKKFGVDSFTKLPAEKQKSLLKSMRAVSTGLTMGGYAAMEGYPTELVLYETLVNGVFGYRELPWYDKEAMHLMQKHNVGDRNSHDWMADPEGFLQKVEPNVSKEVSDSFGLSVTAMYGNKLAIAQTFGEASRQEIARRDNIPLGDVSQESVIERLVELGLDHEATMVQAVEYREQLLKEHEDRLTRVYQELYKENPVEDNLEQIKQQAVEATNKQIQDSNYSSADVIDAMSVRNNINAGRSINTFAQIESFQEAIRGMGEVPGRILNVAETIKDKFKGITPLDATLGIGEVFKEHKEMGQFDYEPLKKAIERKFNITIEPKDEKDLKVIWAQYRHSELADVRVWNGQDAIIANTTKKDGKLDGEFINRSPIEDLLGTKFIIIKEYMKPDGSRVSINDDEVNHSKMQYDMFKKGYSYVFSKKDDAKHYYIKDAKQVDLNLASEFARVDAVLNNNIRERNLSRPKDKQIPERTDGQGLMEYARDRNRWTNEVFKGKKPTDIEVQSASAVYDQLYAHNVHTWKQFIGVDALSDMYADRTSFDIKDATDLNKRAQVLADANPKLDKSNVGIDKFKARIVRWSPESEGLVKILGLPDPVQDDGVLWVTREKAEKMGFVGFGKASIASKGGLVGKFGMHVMTPKEETMIKGSGLNEDMLFFESAVKQSGKKERTTLTLSKDGISFSRKDWGYYEVTEGDEVLPTEDFSKYWQVAKSFNSDILLGGKKIGRFVSSEEGNGKFYVRGISIDDAYKNKGYGKQVYRLLAQKVKEGGFVLHSDNQVSEHAQRVWESLVKSGEAKKDPIGGYEFINEKVKEIKTNEYKLIHDDPQQDVSVVENGATTIRPSNKTFDIPVEDVRFNYGVGEDTEMKSVQLAKQLMNNAEENPILSDFLMKTISEPSYQGDNDNTFKFTNANKEGIDAATIDMDKVGIPEIAKVLRQRPDDIRLRKVVEYLMSHMMESDESTLPEDEQILKELRRTKTQVSNLVHSVGDEAFSPMFVSQPVVRKYLESTLYKVGRDRLERPQWENSFKTRLGYLSPIELASRPDFDKNSIAFGDALKEKKVLFNGKYEKLGDIWDEKLEGYQEFFNNITSVRVPQSDLSGARVLDFKGFIEGGGYNSYVHPHNMKYMDGADLDGDSAFHYFALPKQLTDYLKTPEVSERFTYPDGTVRPSAGGDPNIISKEDLSYLKEPLGMFSPFQLTKANKIANVGKSTLGPGLVASLRAKQLAKVVAKNGGSIKVTIGDKDEVYTLRTKADPLQQKRTQTAIVNGAADAAKGEHPMANVDVVRAANILSVVDVYKGNQKLSDADAITLLSVRNKYKHLAMNDIPIIGALNNLDNAVRPVDFNGNKKELGQILADTRVRTDELRSIIGDEPMHNVWYDSSLLMNDTFGYEPKFGSMVNPISRKIVMEGMDNIIKRPQGNLEKAIVTTVQKLMGRSGLSFNISRLDQTEIWNSILKTYGKDKAKKFLDNFINSRNLYETDLYKALENFPIEGTKLTKDMREALLTELGDKGMYVNNRLVEYDDNSITATGTYKGHEFHKDFKEFDNYFKNKQAYDADWRSTVADADFGPRQRNLWEQVNESDKLIVKNNHELTSTIKMSNALAKYVQDKIDNGKLKVENVDEFLEKNVEPFLNKVTWWRDKLIESQQEVYRLKGKDPSAKKTAFNNYEKTLKDIAKFRNEQDAVGQEAFDAAFTSTMQPNNVTALRPVIEQNYDKLLEERKIEFDRTTKGLTSAQIDKLARAALDATEMSFHHNLYQGEYAITPFSAGIVSPEYIKSYYKIFNRIGKAQLTDVPESINIDKFAQEINLVPKGMGNAPYILAKDENFAKINTREVNTRIGKSSIATLFKDAPRDAFGNIKDLKEKQYYENKVVELRDILATHPELYEKFHLIMPWVTARRTGNVLHRTGEFATKQDLDFFVALMKNDKNKIKELTVGPSWFAKQNSMIADELFSKTKTFDLEQYSAHVIAPDAEGKATPIDMNVTALFGPMNYVSDYGKWHSAIKNKFDDRANNSWSSIDKLGVLDKLNVMFPGLGNKLFGVGVSLLEEPNQHPIKPQQGVYEFAEDFAQRMEDYDKAVKQLTIYKDYADKGRKLFEETKQNKFEFLDKDGKPITMNKQQVVDYFIGKIKEFQKIYSEVENNQPHDHLVQYTGEAFGSKGDFNVVDMNKTQDAITSYGIQTNEMPQISKRKWIEVAVSLKLKTTPIDIYTSTKGNGIYFGEYLSKEGRERFQKRVDAGEYVKSPNVFWRDMSSVQKNAFADKISEAQQIFGFDLGPVKLGYGENYFPHHFTSEKEERQYLMEGLVEAGKFSMAQMEDKSLETIRLFYNGLSDSNYDPQVGGRIFTRLTEKGDVFSTMNYSAIRGRSDRPRPNWTKDPTALQKTYSKLLKETADMGFAVMGNHLLHSFREKNAFTDNKENNDHIVNFTERYMRQVLGFPDLQPKEWAEGYQYGMKNNPWKYHSDEYYVRKLQSVGDTWFGGKLHSDFVGLENMAKDMKFETPEARKEFIDRGKRTLAEQKLSWLSQAEAKWSLLSLLTSAKSYVTNIGSGAVMTLINTSAQDWWAAKDLKKLQSILGENNIKSLADAQKIVGFLGGYEGQFATEINFYPELGKHGVQEVIDAFRKDGTKADIKGIFAKYGIADRALQKGAWFMRDSERRVRQHSMLAHYFNAHRALKQQGFNLQWDDPWLIQIARDGVNASQFLYSNANRPMFMGSLIGKIFHRFQLYAYNSIAFRKNVLDQARGVGVVPGNEAYERFQRMAVTDMFAMGMASMIPMSIFGSALMPPYNTLTAFVKFFFGSDEKAKQDAFYGGLPYPLNVVQTVTPPSARVFVGMLNFAYDQDATKMGNTLYSMFPGQRIIKDTWKTYDQISNKHRNPAIAIDNMTGIPVYSSGYLIQNMNKERGQMQQYLNLYKSRTYSTDKEKMEEDIDTYLRKYQISSP